MGLWKGRSLQSGISAFVKETRASPAGLLSLPRGHSGQWASCEPASGPSPDTALGLPASQAGTRRPQNDESHVSVGYKPPRGSVWKRPRPWAEVLLSPRSLGKSAEPWSPSLRVTLLSLRQTVGGRKNSAGSSGNGRNRQDTGKMNEKLT